MFGCDMMTKCPTWSPLTHCPGPLYAGQENLLGHRPAQLPEHRHWRLREYVRHWRLRKCPTLKIAKMSDIERLQTVIQSTTGEWHINMFQDRRVFLDLFTRPCGDMSGLISATKINLKMNVFGLITAYIVGLIATYEMDLSTLWFGLIAATL